MKIKRFLAPNMREALRAVREEQGPDAVILSNRRVGDYIEIVAALDYDESLVNNTLKWRNADGGRAATDAAEEIESADEDGEVEVALSAEAVRSAGRDAHSDIGALLGDARHSPASVTSHRRADTHVTELDIKPAAAEQTGDVAAMRGEIANLRELLQEQVSSLLWQRTATQHPERAEVLRTLARIGVAADIGDRNSPGRCHSAPATCWRTAALPRSSGRRASARRRRSPSSPRASPCATAAARSRSYRRIRTGSVPTSS